MFLNRGQRDPTTVSWNTADRKVQQHLSNETLPDQRVDDSGDLRRHFSARTARYVHPVVLFKVTTA